MVTCSECKEWVVGKEVNGLFLVCEECGNVLAEWNVDKRWWDWC